MLLLLINLTIVKAITLCQAVLNIDRVSDDSLSAEWIQSALPLAPIARLMSIKYRSRLQFVEYQVDSTSALTSSTIP